MKIKKRKNYEGSIRYITTNEGKVMGLIGTVGDFVEEKLLLECHTDYTMWCFIKSDKDVFFGNMRCVVLDEARNYMNKLGYK